MSKAIVRSIKNVTNGYTTAQVKVRNATSNDSWGPSTSDMQEISRLTYENHELFEVMDMLDRRLNDKGKNWRHVMKALTVLDYIIHTGSENVVLWCKDNLYIIKTLREFHYIDESGRDQGSSIRAKAKELTSLLQDDDRLREERMNRGSSRRRRRQQQGNARPARDTPSPPINGNRRNTNPEDADEIQRALEESRRTAEADERRRKAMEGSDEDLRKAILLSEEEERLRDHQQNNVLFGNNSQPNLIDTSEPAPLQQQYFYQQQQPAQQVVYGQATDLFGNPIYQPQQQQSVSTGYLQSAYATTGGGFPQYTGYPQQQQQQLYQTTTGYQQQQQPQNTEPEPLKPLKTGSNNPFAKPDLFSNNTNGASTQPNLQQLQQQQLQQQQQQQLQFQQQQLQQQQQQQQPVRPQRTNSNFDQNHMNDLNNLLSNGDGIDTFGNVGQQRIPAQHTKSTFINSAGQGLQQLPTNNPFLSQQYTGIATTNPVQPAFTGYGFGNAGQPYQQPQSQQQRTGFNNLIDL